MADRPSLHRATVRATRLALLGGGACGLVTLAALVPSLGRGAAIAALLVVLCGLAAQRRRVAWVAVEILIFTAQFALVGAIVTGTNIPSLAVLPVLGIWAAAALWTRVDHDVLAYGAGPITLAQGLILSEVIDSWEAEIALALLVPLALLSVILVEARGSHAVRRRLPAAAGGGTEESSNAIRRRLVAGLALGLLCLATMLGLRLGGNTLIARFVDPLPTEGSFDPMDAEPEFGREVVNKSRFDDQIDYGGDLDSPSGDDVILEVGAKRRLGAPGRIAEGLYLGALRLDRFGPQGVLLDATPTRRGDADDGVDDGWVELGDTDRGWTLELEVASVPLTVGESGRTPLFHTGELLQAEFEEVWHHPRGVTTAVGPRRGPLEYRVRTTTPPAPEDAFASGLAGRPGGYSLELPPESPELDVLRELAREIVGDAPDAGQAVQAVLAHFADGYDYSFLGSEFDGLAGLVDFVERRSGYCQAYAATSVLLLRLSGVPARAVVGYYLDEYDAERSIYIGRSQDAHAWFEVHFDGLGWVAFDSTPPGALTGAPTGEDSGAEGPLIGRLELLLLLSVGTLFTLGLITGARRLGRHRGEDRADDAPPPPGWYGELLDALERAGFPRPIGHTPRELAQELERVEDLEAAALRDATDVLYDERYGGHEPTERELKAVRSLTGRLGQRQLPRKR